jgi:CRP-like cAMP-binding protein
MNETRKYPAQENSRDKLIQLFRNTNLVSLQKAEEFAGHFQHRKFNKNDFLLQEGKICNDYLFLENGFMRSYAYDTEGNDITTNFYTSNQVVFEVSSFFNCTPSKENIQALTDCRGWFLTYQELNRLFHEVNEFRDFGRHILVRGFSSLKIRMLSMITETAEERYASLLISNPEIFLYAPLKNIASFLGITDTSLSRIRKDFSKK